VMNFGAQTKKLLRAYWHTRSARTLQADAGPYATWFYDTVFGVVCSHCCERNFEYLNWLSTRTWRGTGRPHVWLCHALLVSFFFKHRCRSDDGHQILTLVRLWPEFIKLVKNVGPKNLAAQEHQHLEYCAIWSCKLIIVYCDWSSTSTNGFIQKYHEGKPKFKFERQ